MFENCVDMWVLTLIQPNNGFLKYFYIYMYFKKQFVEEISVTFCSGKNFGCLVYTVLTLIHIISKIEKQ